MSYFFPVFSRDTVSVELEEAVGRAMLTITKGPRPAELSKNTEAQRKGMFARRRIVGRMHDQGKTIDEICKQYGWVDSTVKRDLKKMGLKPHRKPPQEVTDRRELVKGMLLNGLTRKDIADLLDITPITASRDIKLAREQLCH